MSVLPKLTAMRDVIYKALSAYPDVTVFSAQEGFAPNILTFGIRGVRGEVIVHAFENMRFIFRPQVHVRPKQVSQQEA